MRLTGVHRVMHNTCTKHGRDIRTQYIGSTSILLWRKDWSSIRLDRTPSFFKKHFQLIVFRKLLGWKLEKSYTRKYACHLDFFPRSHWNTNGKENWVQNMLNDQKLGNFLEVSNRTNQFQIQVVKEWRPVITRDVISVQDGRKTSRSQEIEPVVETSKTHTRSSDDSKSLNVEMGTWSNGATRCWNKHWIVPDGCQTRSCHESIRFNVGDETLRDRTG